MKKIIKKGKKIFPPFGRFFDHFWSLVCWKRLLGSVSGVRRRSTEQKKVILTKRCKARLLDIMCRKNGVCVSRCICPRNHGGKKVICKK